MCLEVADRKECKIIMKNEVVKKSTEITIEGFDDFETEIKCLNILDINDKKKLLNQMIQNINVADLFNKIEPKTEYIVQFPLEALNDVKSGVTSMNVNSKTGVMWPQLMKKGEDGRTHIAHNLPIKEEIIINGSSLQDFSLTQHNIYMQQQLNNISNQISKVMDTVEKIERGQKTDRIGKLSAGKKQIMYALNLEDEKERRDSILLGINTLIEFQQQILLLMKDRIERYEPISCKLISRCLKEFFKEGYLENRYQEYNEIQEYYSLYLQATQMIATAYIFLGSYKNVNEVFIDAKDELRKINFNNIETLKYILKEEELFFLNFEKNINFEKRLAINQSKKIDCVRISITGEELLEVYDYGRKRKI